MKKVYILLFLFVLAFFSCSEKIKLVSPENEFKLTTLNPVFEWDYSGDMDSQQLFEIQIGTQEDFSEGTFNLYFAEERSFRPNERLENKKQYFWRVRVIEKDRSSGEWTDVYSFNTESSLYAPKLISPFYKELIEDKEILFRWEKIDGAASYEFQLAGSNSFEDVQIEATLFGPEYRLARQLDSGNYYWRVRSGDNKQEWSAWSDPYVFEMEDMRFKSRAYLLYTYSSEESGFIIYMLMEDGSIEELPVNVADEIIDKGFQAVFSPVTQSIIYTKYDWESGNQGIYSYDLESHISTSVTGHYSDYSLLDLSPDGNRILAASYTEGYNDIYIEDINNNSSQFVTSIEAYNMYYFPARWVSYNEVVFADQSNGKLILMNLSSDPLAGEIDLSNSQIDPNSNWFEMSVNRQWIFDSYDSSYKDGYVELDTGNIVFFEHSAEGNRNYKWSPDGESIMFVSSRDNDGSIYLMDKTGSNVRQIAYLNSGGISLLGYIQNGEIMAFEKMDKDYNSYIYFLDWKTGVLRNITEENDLVPIMDAMACPHLFIRNGNDYIKHSELIGHFTGKEMEGTEQIEIPASYVQNKRLIIKIQEDLHEITYIDNIRILYGDDIITPVSCISKLDSVDGNYMILYKGDSIEIEFYLPDLTEGNKIILESTGYYESLQGS